MLASIKLPYLEKMDERAGLQVWIVDGSYIRGHIDEEFTNFGQHYRYKYIPENEFWIDQGTSPMNGVFISTICWWNTA